MGDLLHILLLVWSFCVLGVPLFFINYIRPTSLATDFAQQKSVRIHESATAFSAEWDRLTSSCSWLCSWSWCLNLVTALLTILVLRLEHGWFELLLDWSSLSPLEDRLTATMLIFEMKKLLFSMLGNLIWLIVVNFIILGLDLSCRNSVWAIEFHYVIRLELLTKIVASFTCSATLVFQNIRW